MPVKHPLELLLASASWGRKNILTQAGVNFSTFVTDVDEPALLASNPGLSATEQVLCLAKAKAQAAATANLETSANLILGCDSMLEIGGEVVGKPHVSEVAVARWLKMRGQSGILHTGHWLIDPASGKSSGKTRSTTVHFANITEAQIRAYVATGEPLEVAGAFTIDGYGGALIDGIVGDPHAVVGLSLPLLRELMSELGYEIYEFWRDESQVNS